MSLRDTRGGSVSYYPSPTCLSETIGRHFSLRPCAVGCETHERAKLERVCRYMARGPIAQERLSVDGDGLVVLELKRAFSDGTTHVLFEPQDFMARSLACIGRK